jgi:NAD(P)-dependent dehydrogenase (short-subunit alcohol dehydrogenase family)
MGRELVIQLVDQGCSVATCDVNADTMAETVDRATKEAPSAVKITTHVADVSDEAAVGRFRDEVVEQHGTDHVNALFNNAGIGGGGSFVAGDRHAWDRTFGVCWGGVYNCSRAFLPLLVAADEGVIVNTSSVNGFWASLGPGVPHTAYSAAKFAVKGFTEALMEDLRVNAPHVTAAVVMPGHIGTDIVINSRRIISGHEDMTADDVAQVRADIARRGLPVDGLDDEALKGFIQTLGEGFRDNAPMSAADAAAFILDSVKSGKWRILVGDDAVALDQAVRADPERAYGPDGIGLSTITLGR